MRLRGAGEKGRVRRRRSLFRGCPLSANGPSGGAPSLSCAWPGGAGASGESVCPSTDARRGIGVSSPPPQQLAGGGRLSPQIRGLVSVRRDRQPGGRDRHCPLPVLQQPWVGAPKSPPFRWAPASSSAAARFVGCTGRPGAWKETPQPRAEGGPGTVGVKEAIRLVLQPLRYSCPLPPFRLWISCPASAETDLIVLRGSLGEAHVARGS